MSARGGPAEADVVPGGRGFSRRDLFKILGLLGVGTLAFRRALAALAEGAPRVTRKMIRRAGWISGLDLTPAELRLMREDVEEAARSFARLREVPLANDVPPALRFDAAPHARCAPIERSRSMPGPPIDVRRPASDDDLASASVTELSSLLRTKQVSSVELTRLYLDRLRRFDPLLRCVITLTEDLALEQARRADSELAAGECRGFLHGIPWGVKDLFAVPGYRTTWGAEPYRDQILPHKATVVARLEEAGAVLAAKLSVGALAWGDVWFDAMTRNPWKPEQGSSGSSAGSASAVAASLVGFAVGTETWGSIVSPCTRCGATGLRPTFGRVSRHGAMALSWSMDKAGPIARSVEDCALAFDAIHGADPLDPASVDRPFRWPADRDAAALRVGYVESLFEEDRTEGVEDPQARDAMREWREFDLRTLEVLRGLGFDLVPIELPATLPVDELSFILTAEASAAFDELTRSGRDDLLTRQVRDAWPNVLRTGQMIPAVEYIRANRIRTLVMRELEQALDGIDAYVAPSYGGNHLLRTNLTGHPAVVVPNGFRSSDGTPTSITFGGRLFGESDVLALAGAYQRATDFHLRRPRLVEAAAPEPG
jgi:Asp-tRNA(Asn)/Glu-tRNA(Gln) amidotransferase A subunit family amidase